MAAFPGDKEWGIDIQAYISSVFGKTIHGARIKSLSDMVVGLMSGRLLTVTGIANSIAAINEISPKHAVKQVDRAIGNEKLAVWEIFDLWVINQIRGQTDITVAMDWTEFDDDDQSTIALNLITNHGRATPLIWLTVWKSEIKHSRNDWEDLCLSKLRNIVGKDVNVTIVADRGFGDAMLYKFLYEINFRFVIRFKGNIYVESRSGETKIASEFLGKNGRARKIDRAKVTSEKVEVDSVVCVKEKDMKDAWYLAVGGLNITSKEAMRIYSKRWTIEPSFRDCKDIRFGTGMLTARVSEPQRRDRLLLVSALATSVLTTIGEASERIGLDKSIKSNTSKKRTHSLIRQGAILFAMMLLSTGDRFLELIGSFNEIMGAHNYLFGVIGAS